MFGTQALAAWLFCPVTSGEALSVFIVFYRMLKAASRL